MRISIPYDQSESFGVPSVLVLHHVSSNYNVYVGRSKKRPITVIISSSGESSMSGPYLSAAEVTAGADDKPTAFSWAKTRPAWRKDVDDAAWEDEDEADW